MMSCCVRGRLRLFQHTATRRWLLRAPSLGGGRSFVSTHSHPKVAAYDDGAIEIEAIVSTHSHPKVAAPSGWPCALVISFQHTATRRWLPDGLYISPVFRLFQHTATRRWLRRSPECFSQIHGFNTQPPEGGCVIDKEVLINPGVSTHSHPKVAAVGHTGIKRPKTSFNTQPPEGGCGYVAFGGKNQKVSTHSHPKVAAGCHMVQFWW